DEGRPDLVDAAHSKVRASCDRFPEVYGNAASPALLSGRRNAVQKGPHGAPGDRARHYRLQAVLMHTSTPASQTSRLEQRLPAGRFAITAEITPPLSCERADVTTKALPLRGLADAVNVTDGAGARAHMSATAAAVFR